MVNCYDNKRCSVGCYTIKGVNMKNPFKFFKEEVDRYATILGLNEWDIQCSHGKIEGDVVANVSTNYRGLMAHIRLNKNAKDQYTTAKKVSQLAAHEVLHIFMTEFDDLARARYCMEAELDVAEHRIVNTLDKILVDYK